MYFQALIRKALCVTVREMIETTRWWEQSEGTLPGACTTPPNKGGERRSGQIETMSGRQVVECIPNFSEGRRTDVIQAIADAIHETAGCSLLDVDSGVSNNRTVYTYVGAPTEVVQAALAAARVAFQRIDMSKHKGLF